MCSTHSCVGRAIGVTCVCRLMVVMRVLLVGQIMLQTCVGERGPAPGALAAAAAAATATAAASGPTGATHSCCLTAVVTSHRCAGLMGRKVRINVEKGEMEGGKRGKEGG